MADKPGWLSNLKGFITIEKVLDLSGLKSLHISIGNNNSGNSLIRVDRSQHVHLDLGADVLNDPKKRLQAQEFVRETVAKHEIPVLSQGALEVARDISKEHQYDDLLHYFSDKIPSSDVPILRAALYMRKLLDEGVHVDSYKQDIVASYGPRGANIANLCSRGYFESQIKPLYEQLSQRPNFTPQMFIDSYDVLVTQAPFAVFVSGVKSDAELTAELEHKIQYNRMYGIHHLNIHAIGMDNVHKLQELLRNPQISQTFTTEPAISSEGSIMNAQIFF